MGPLREPRSFCVRSFEAAPSLLPPLREEEASLRARGFDVRFVDGALSNRTVQATLARRRDGEMVTEERHTGTRARLSAGGHTLSSAAANTFQPAVGTADAVSPRLAPALSGSLAPPGKGGPREAWECLASRSLIIVARPRLIERGPPHAAPSGNLREPRRGPPARPATPRAGCPRRPALRRPPGQRVCRPSGAASSALNHSCCSTATSAAYPAPPRPVATLRPTHIKPPSISQRPAAHAPTRNEP